jgi:ribosome-associated heat shock protein Hsp15
VSLERQRIDRWLWHARVVRTRTNAAALAQSGHVRVNGQRIAASARTIRSGDVLTVALPGAVMVLRVLGFTERRGAFSEAKFLYEDLSPPKERDVPEEGAVKRPGGMGRPTKKDRRALDRLRARDSILED